MEELAVTFMLQGVLFLLSTCLAASLNDASSLLAFKNYITSDPNGILTKNWSQETYFCTWIGVTCSRRHSRVTALNLSRMDLQGTIPKEIGNLSFLTYLDMSYNRFKDPIPDEIGNLRRLRELIMEYNMLDGYVPLTFGSLTNVQKLILAGNSLTGTIPWSVFNFSSLKVINLRDNHLSGTLPSDICHQFPDLEYLNLRNNSKIDGEIPKSLCRCAQLMVLDLFANRFTGSIPTEIGNLSRLQALHLRRNLLTGTIPASISNLSNLEVFIIRENSIEGEVPSQIGRLASSLRTLDFGENRLMGEVSDSIFNLSRLQSLSLLKNEFSGKLPFSIDKGLPNLEGLFLHGNQFSGSIPNSITNISTLTHLSLSNNSFSGHIPITLGNLHQLQLLDFAENHFTNDLSIPEQDFLTSVSNCKYLELIQFAINPITGILPKSIGSSNLSLAVDSLVAYSCKIKGKIPSEIGNLSSLIWLTLGDNELTGVITESLQRLSNLQLFEVYFNNLQGSIPHSFCNLKNLFSVLFRQNELSGQIPNCLGNLTSLQIIDASENSFNSSIPSTFWLHKAFRGIFLANNFFDGSLPEEISNLERLTKLNLNGNQLWGKIPSTISKLQSLDILALSNNKFDGFIPGSFSNLMALEYLDLSHNNLSGSIPKSLENLPNLVYFNVSLNELSGEIPNGGPFVNFTADSFQGNRALCGDSRFKVVACKKNIIPKPSRNHKLLRYLLPPLASIVVAVTVVILCLRCQVNKSLLATLSNFPVGPTHERISYNQILRATSNFDEGNLRGRGGYGLVYRGIFSNGMISAVKVFNSDLQSELKSFDTECRIMRSIRHRNLVKIITSCSSINFKALVMEYMPNGNLDKWLYSPELSLNLVQRLRIMIDVACAIDYLHLGYLSPIVHCDLKPSNVLLDEDMVAHVGDFGIAKLFTEDQRMAHTKTLGTIGYMAPEYGSTGLVSTMVDVYSYGILLMETFTKKKPTDEMFFGELTLTKWVSESFLGGIMQIVDANLLNMDEDMVRVKQEIFKQEMFIDEDTVRVKQEIFLTAIFGLALECTVDLPEARISMRDVLFKLEKIKTQLLQ